MQNKSTIKVVMFSGGRGTATITESLMQHPQVELTLLVNAYDDGLSTGALRRFIPGLLGPSDIRKNISRLIHGNEKSKNALKYFIEYRLPVAYPYDNGVRLLDDLIKLNIDLQLSDLKEQYGLLSINHCKKISASCLSFKTYVEKQHGLGNVFDFSNVSMGNILFAGIYLNNENNFNRAIASFADMCEVVSNVYNVTDGENLVLLALKDDGTLIKNEAELVSTQNNSNILDIFLLRRYLDENEYEELKNASKEKIHEYLTERSVFPKINNDIINEVENADIIIYGPGTQHSSLFPTYITLGLTECIVNNKLAEKIFISNIKKDHEIPGETANTLAKKLLYYLNRKNTINCSLNDLVTYFFCNTSELKNENYLEYNIRDLIFPNDSVVLTDWESKSGQHSGGRVVDELISIINSKLQLKLQSFHHQVSIVVPAYNEEKTVADVIHELNLLDISRLNLTKEIIVVDGGSDDATYDIIQSSKNIRCYQLQQKPGRGAVLRYGFLKANGSIIVTFPSDKEYNPQDVYKLLEVFINTKTLALFGSRSIKCINLSDRIRSIYKNNYLLYLISKYGGIFISIFSLLLYNRFITDPLTGIKIFDSRVLKRLDLKCNSIDLESELISKISKSGIYILEFPIDYIPRTKKQGKKTTVAHGFKALYTLVKYRFTK